MVAMVWTVAAADITVFHSTVGDKAKIAISGTVVPAKGKPKPAVVAEAAECLTRVWTSATLGN